MWESIWLTFLLQLNGLVAFGVPNESGTLLENSDNMFRGP